jgi:hypothetical protein
MPTAQDIERYRKNWQDEIDSAARYHAMADVEGRAGVATVYRDLAAMEEKHAAFWEQRLTDAGAPAGPRRIGWRTRVLVWLASHFGAGLVLPTIAAAEHRDRNDYRGQVETGGQHEALVLKSMWSVRLPRATDATDDARIMARVQAEVIAEGRTDRAIEQVVGRLSPEPSVSEARWRIAEADDDD